MPSLSQYTRASDAKLAGDTKRRTEDRPLRVHWIDIPTWHGSEDALPSRGMGEFVPQGGQISGPQIKRPFDPVD